MITYTKCLAIKKQVDVLVAGGGPAGITAAVAAARAGRKVLLVEASGALGGLGTSGMVPAFAPFYDGKHMLCGGIGMEIRRKVSKQVPPETYWTSIEAEELKRVYDDLVTEAGVEVLFFTTLADMITEGRRLEAAVLTSKQGLYAVQAKVFIDCTGDGTLAALAGSEFEVGDENRNVMPPTLCSLWSGIDQPVYRKANVSQHLEQAIGDGVFTFEDRHLSGLFLRGEDIGGGNVGHIFDTDCLDEASMTHAMMWGRRSMEEYVRFYREYVPGCDHIKLMGTAPLLGVRESRRIRCDYMLGVNDFIARADFEDEIGRYCYPVDIHVMNTDKDEYERFLAEYTKDLHYEEGESYGIPYRSLIPVSFDNLLTAGRCMGTDRQMEASIRVMPGCFITGQAAGTAAALAVESEGCVRSVDVKALQRRLAENGAYLREGLAEQAEESVDPIQPAVEADAETIDRIMQFTAQNMKQRDWFFDDDIHFIRRHINSEEGYTLKYMVDGEIAGFLIIRYPGSDADNLGLYLNLNEKQLQTVAHMESTCVLPKYRGRRIFQKLTARALEIEREKNRTRYFMGTAHPDNQYSMNIFLKSGFQIAKTVQKYDNWPRNVMLLKM